MLQAENLFLAVAIIAVAYAWHRTGFRTPPFLRLTAHVSRLTVIVCGWMLIVGIVAKSVAGGFFGDGRVQIAQSGQMYAYRAREPLRFWGEIAGELLVVGGTGFALVVLGRSGRTEVQRADT